METQDALTQKAVDLAQSFKAMPPGEEIGTFYDNMEPEVYNEMLKVVNFSEKDEIAKKVYKPAEEGGLGLPKDTAVFDAGCGTGEIGKMLTEAGYTNIEGADASEKFVEHAKKQGWYKECDAFYFGRGLD